MFIYKYLKQKKKLEELKAEIIDLELQNDNKEKEIQKCKSKMTDEINQLKSDNKLYYSHLEHSKKEYDKLQFIHELFKKQCESEKEILFNKISDLKHKEHQKVGAIGGLKRSNNKLKKERKEMMELINRLIIELKKKPNQRKTPTINELKKYYKNY